MKLTINFSEFDQISVGNVNNKRVLTLVKNNSASYVQVPTCLDYTISNNLIEIFCNSNLQKDASIFNIFSKTVNDIKNNSLNLAKKKILLKGLGFRSTFDSSSSTLQLHKINLCILSSYCIKSLPHLLEGEHYL